ncbi:hypothetical protein KAR91_14970 [Candidatus Pacearchaeota archaeon]|nr:hypothetical protein [Candidatus Pacearchaeota archaeon]
MFTQKKEVDLEAYADFIKENIDVIEIASNLDHIGRGGEQQTYDNQKRLEEFGVKIAPVHHARDEDSWLQRYLDEGYDHIFLGGMVPETTNYLRKWLDRIWPRYLCNPDGTAKVKVHGFGLTTEALMFRYPWFSVDSTSWVMTAAMGTLYLDLPHRNMKVCVSDSSPKMKKAGQHFSTLTDIEQKTIREYVHARGFNIEDLAEDYAWRWRWNVEFFRRQMEGAPEIKFIKQQTELFA